MLKVMNLVKKRNTVIWENNYVEEEMEKGTVSPTDCAHFVYI